MKPFWLNIEHFRLGSNNLQNNDFYNRNSTMEIDIYNRNSTDGICHKFYFSLEKNNGKRSHSGHKSKKIHWALKTSAIIIFTTGMQQWKSGINVLIIWRIEENEAILIKNRKLCLGPENLQNNYFYNRNSTMEIWHNFSYYLEKNKGK